MYGSSGEPIDSLFFTGNPLYGINHSITSHSNLLSYTGIDNSHASVAIPMEFMHMVDTIIGEATGCAQIQDNIWEGSGCILERGKGYDALRLQIIPSKDTTNVVT